MFGTALLIVLLIIGVRSFIALRRESAVRRQFLQPRRLEILVLLYPLGPITLLVGPLLAPQVLIFATAVALYVTAYVVASKEQQTLECSGTDRTKGALAATALSALGAIVGLIYVGLAGVFALIGYAAQSQSLATG